jgi:hypothetical protein
MERQGEGAPDAGQGAENGGVRAAPVRAANQIRIDYQMAVLALTFGHRIDFLQRCDIYLPHQAKSTVLTAFCEVHTTTRTDRACSLRRSVSTPCQQIRVTSPSDGRLCARAARPL